VPTVLNVDQTLKSAICRITAGRDRWRVLAETWHDQDSWRGRLLFQPENGGGAERQSAVLLEGRTHEEVLAQAHDLGEEYLKRLLHSL
jgi:hypothetical protein